MTAVEAGTSDGSSKRTRTPLSQAWANSIAKRLRAESSSRVPYRLGATEIPSISSGYVKPKSSASVGIRSTSDTRLSTSPSSSPGPETRSGIRDDVWIESTAVVQASPSEIEAFTVVGQEDEEGSIAQALVFQCSKQ